MMGGNVTLDYVERHALFSFFNNSYQKGECASKIFWGELLHFAL